jgi:hypothetical protein
VKITARFIHSNQGVATDRVVPPPIEGTFRMFSILTVRQHSRLLTALLLPIIAISLSGCGTLFGGDSLDIEITSIPPGAKVRVDGKVLGTTPLSYTIDPLQPNEVQAKFDGYKDYDGRIDITLNLPAVLDILFFPTILVDLLTGHWARGRDLNITFYDDQGNAAPGAEDW